MHFYVLFPALLLLQRRLGVMALVSTLAISLGLRSYLWITQGQVQELAYLTIIGHFDQFLLGMVFFHASRTRLFVKHGSKIFFATLLAILGYWHVLNGWGGFYDLQGRYPSPSALWIILPTIEGAAWGAIIASYENTSFSLPAIIDRILARIGEVS